jgi:hypothetical protein
MSSDPPLKSIRPTLAVPLLLIYPVASAISMLATRAGAVGPRNFTSAPRGGIVEHDAIRAPRLVHRLPPPTVMYRQKSCWCPGLDAAVAAITSSAADIEPTSMVPGERVVAAGTIPPCGPMMVELPPTAIVPALP